MTRVGNSPNSPPYARPRRALRQVSTTRSARFGDRDRNPSTPDQPATLPFTTNEESSGIVDVSDILGQPGEDVYLLDVQAHYPAATDPALAPFAAEVVEGGQLLAMTLATARHPGFDLIG